jgi:DNA-binding SARP family transcriptional activator
MDGPADADGDATLPLRAVHQVARGRIALRVLGEVELHGPRGMFAPAGSRPGAVLALLAIDAGEIVPVDRLLDELWTAPAIAGDAKRVQVNVLRLRRALGRIAPDVDPAAAVRTRRFGYALEIEPEAIDAVRFARLVARGRRELGGGDHRRAATTLRGALALWRGTPYGDYVYEPFVAAEVRRLEELRRCAVELRIEAQLALGAHSTVATELERLIARDPLRERLHALRILALYRCGRQGEALSAYRAAHATLDDALGIEPGPELRRLQRAVLEQSTWLELGREAVPAAPATGDQAA